VADRLKNKMIKTVLLASLILALVLGTRQQANAQDGWTTLLKIAKNFTDSCIAVGHTKAQCNEIFNKLGKK
jgi:hypothetical protein